MAPAHDHLAANAEALASASTAMMDAAFIAYLIQQREHVLTERPYVLTDNQPLAVHELLRWLGDQQNIAYASGVMPAVQGSKRLSNARMLASDYRFIYLDYVSGYGALLAAMD